MVQMFYYENRGKCCKKLLRYNGYPSKVRGMVDRHVLPSVYSLLHAACLGRRHPITHVILKQSDQLLIKSHGDPWRFASRRIHCR
jgi:hypothetical protein